MKSWNQCRHPELGPMKFGLETGQPYRLCLTCNARLYSDVVTIPVGCPHPEGSPRNFAEKGPRHDTQ